MLGIIHGVILVLLVLLSLYDLATANLFSAFLSSSMRTPAVVLLIGLARHGRGRSDGRMVMAVADIAMLLILSAFLLQGLRVASGVATTAAVLLIVLTIAALASVALARPGTRSTRVRRSMAHNLGGLAFVVLGLVSLFAPLLSTGTRFPLDVVGLATTPTVVGLALATLVWWSGTGWLMAMNAIGHLVWVVNAAALGSIPTAANQLLSGVLSAVLAARPPRVLGERSPSLGPRQARPSAAAVGWAVTGAILLVPSLLLGPFYPRLIDCFDCPPPSPLAGPSMALDAVLLVALPAVAIALALSVRSGRGRRGEFAWIGVVASAVVLGQGLLALFDVPGFEFFLSVAPAAAIALTGFAFAIARPAFIVGAGSWSAAAAALAGLIWMSAFAGSRLAPLDLTLVQLATLISGVLVTVALGREFAIRADAAVEDAPRA